MKITNVLKKTCICGALLLSSWIAAQAQTTTTWTGTSGGEWNVDGNWDVAVTPGDNTNVVLNLARTINYNVPMIAGDIRSFTNFSGSVNINTNGFIIGGSGATACFFWGNARMIVGTNGVLNVTNGGITLSTNSTIGVLPGGSLIAKNIFAVGNFGSSGSGGGSGSFTNTGGFVTLGGLTVNAKAGNPNVCLALINGGTNNLGNVIVGRAGSSFATLGTEGLVINSGLVNMTSLRMSDNSFMTTYVAGGIVTNTGLFTFQNTTAARGSRFVQTGGLFVETDPNLIVANPPGVASGSPPFSTLAVLGGTNIAGGILFTGIPNTVLGQVNFTNAGNMYLGSGGISSNGTAAVNVSLNNGGIFGAYADWANNVTLKVNTSSTFTFNCADVDGTPHNITLNAVVNGPGSIGLVKAGGGTLTMNSNNTYVANTLINAGSLVLGSGGAISSSPNIIVGSGTTFDVSQVSGGYILGASQTLQGSGVVTGAVTTVFGATINPGSNAITGILSLSNGLTEVAGTVNHFDLAATPGPGNDLLIVAGDLTVSSPVTNQISGGTSGYVYPLIQYGGNFVGDISSFVVSGAIGAMSNSVTDKTIYFVALNTTRGPTNITWIGNPANSNWDVTITTNWLNNGVLDYFILNDNARFDNTAGTNLLVNIPGNVQPGSVVVDSTSNYVFAGSASIIGSGGITKTNTGTLTILSTNGYTGPTVISGGVLEAPLIANVSTASSIGAPAADPATLVLNGGTLRYLGDTVSSDRPGTLNAGLQTFDVASSAATLALSGSFGGGGTLVKYGPGTMNLSGNNTYSGNTVISNGVLQISSAGGLGNSIITNFGSTLRLSIANNWANSLNVNGSCVVDLANVGGDIAVNGAWSGSGTVNIISQRTNTLTFTMGGGGNNGGSMANFTGTLNCGTNTGNIRFNDSANNNFGNTNAVFDIGTGSATLLARNGGITISLGELRGGVNTKLSGRGNGTASTLTWAIGGKNTSSTFDGVIKDGGNATAIIKEGTGTLSLSGTSTYTGTTTVSNGVLALIGSGSIGNSSIINIVPGAFLDVSGRGDGTLSLGSGQQLRGRGTILGSLSGGSGIVSPGGGTGGGIGTLTVNNNINLGGTTWMKVNRNGGSTISDRLVSSGAAVNYNGTLLVTNIGSTLQAGDTFTLFNGTSYNGSFTSILPANYRWDTSQLNANGSITFQGFIKFVITNIDLSDLVNGNISISGTNGSFNGSVNILTSTNLSLPISQWTTNAESIPLYPDGHLDPSDGTFSVDPTLPQLFILVQPQ